MSLLFDYWEHSPPAAEALATIERMLLSYFDAGQRPSVPVPAKPAQVVDLQSMPFLQQGTPIPWMTAEEYLRMKDQKESHGNAA